MKEKLYISISVFIISVSALIGFNLLSSHTFSNIISFLGCGFSFLFLLFPDKSINKKPSPIKGSFYILAPLLEFLVAFIYLILMVVLKKYIFTKITTFVLFFWIVIFQYFLLRNVTFTGFSNIILKTYVVSKKRRVFIILINIINVITIFAVLGGQYLIDVLEISFSIYLVIVSLMYIIVCDFLPIFKRRIRFSFRLMNIYYSKQ